MEIAVKVRMATKPESKIAAYADVTLSFREGSVQLKSFSIFKPNGKPAWVAAPATKGEKHFFPYIVLTGDIQDQVKTAILTEYEKLQKQATV